MDCSKMFSVGCDDACLCDGGYDTLCNVYLTINVDNQIELLHRTILPPCLPHAPPTTQPSHIHYDTAHRKLHYLDVPLRIDSPLHSSDQRHMSLEPVASAYAHLPTQDVRPTGIAGFMFPSTWVAFCAGTHICSMQQFACCSFVSYVLGGRR
jgi:hypothetical protein